jgi:uncharacterized protein (DUF2236 family)
MVCRCYCAYHMTGTLFPDAEALLVGPESMTWRAASDARLYLVMLYPLLLQVAHPTVGAGVRERELPETWDGFRDYFDSVVENELVRTESVERVIHSVKNAANPLPSLPDPLWRVLRLPAACSLWIGGIGLVDPALRHRLGIAWSRSEELSFRGLGAVSRALTPLMPKRLRIMGPDQLRLRRRAIARGPLGGDSGTGPPRRANSSSLAA